jgi:RNA polymerase sigma-70 factor, ECF subfamily
MHTTPDRVGAVDAYTGWSDAELARDSAHDPAAFTALYQRYARRVFWFVRSHTGSREDAADLTQQVFLRCYAALADYQDRGVPFSAWLFRIARNMVIDFYRRRHPAVSWERLTAHDEMALTQPGPYPMAPGGRLEEMEALIAGLPPGKRELIALRFGAGLSVREIAQVVGKSEAAVRKQLQRLIRDLKEAYEHV